MSAMEVYNKKLEELAIVKEVNLVMMDTLIASLTWVLQYTEKNNILLPDMDGIKSLLRTVRMLTEEGRYPSPNLQHIFQTLPNETESSIRRKFTDEESDADFTEPEKTTLIRFV